MKKQRILWLLIPTLLFTAGCISTPYQHVDHYLLQVKKPVRIRHHKKTISIGQVRINQQFSGTNFVYRDTDIHYLTVLSRLFSTPGNTSSATIGTVSEPNTFIWSRGTFK